MLEESLGDLEAEPDAGRSWREIRAELRADR